MDTKHEEMKTKTVLVPGIVPMKESENSKESTLPPSCNSKLDSKYDTVSDVSSLPSWSLEDCNFTTAPIPFCTSLCWSPSVSQCVSPARSICSSTNVSPSAALAHSSCSSPVVASPCVSPAHSTCSSVVITDVENPPSKYLLVQINVTDDEQEEVVEEDIVITQITPANKALIHMGDANPVTDPHTQAHAVYRHQIFPSMNGCPDF